MWRLVYGDRSFSNVSSVAGTSFSKGKSTRTPQFKWISTECVWLRVAGLRGGNPRSHAYQPLPPPLSEGPWGSEKIRFTPPDRDFKMPLGNSAVIHQQVQACDTHALEHCSQRTMKQAWVPATPRMRPRPPMLSWRTRRRRLHCATPLRWHSRRDRSHPPGQKAA